MAYSQADLDKLRAAIASGARSVSYDGHTVTRYSLAEMLTLERRIARALGESRTNVAYPEFSRDGL